MGMDSGTQCAWLVRPLRRFSSCKAIPLQAGRLQQSQLEPEFRRLSRRLVSFSDCLRATGCGEDADTEPEFRGQAVWDQDHWQYGTAGGSVGLLQGSGAEVVDDGAEVDVFVLVGADVDTDVQ